MLKCENLPRTNSTKYETQNILVKFQQIEHTSEVNEKPSSIDDPPKCSLPGPVKQAVANFKVAFSILDSESPTVVPSNAPLLTVVMVTRCRLNVAMIGSVASFVIDGCERNFCKKVVIQLRTIIIMWCLYVVFMEISRN